MYKHKKIATSRFEFHYHMRQLFNPFKITFLNVDFLGREWGKPWRQGGRCLMYCSLVLEIIHAPVQILNIYYDVLHNSLMLLIKTSAHNATIRWLTHHLKL